MKHAKCYKVGYPRPQFVRDNFSLLNGEWEFCLDRNNIGESEKWFLKPKFDLKINVPYPYQAQMSGISDKEFCQVVWYRQKFNFSGNKRTVLNFEGSDYFTKVWVNGIYVGCNEGGYHRFSFDITDCLKDGDADIVVRAEDSFDAAQPRGKQRWQKNNFACWYTEITGIWKSVWAESINSEHIERVEYRTSYNDYSLTCNYYVNTNFRGNLMLKTVIEYDGETIVDSMNRVTQEEFTVTFDIRSKVDAFKVRGWNEYCPNIYDISLELYADGVLLDKVGSYFGFANYGKENNYLTNNAGPLYLKMILDQGYFDGGLLTADEEQLLLDIQLVKEIGLNGIRKHQKIENDLFYYYCDILGVYCWLEMPSSYDYNSRGVQRIVDQWTKIVRDHSNHPSIIAYVPFNESWGVMQILTNKAQQDFTKGVYYITKALSPDKLVISNDGWEHTKSDILTLHNYGPDGEWLNLAYKDFDELIDNRTVIAPPTKLPFATGHAYEGQPIMISEFAGIAFAKDKNQENWGYGAMEKDEDAFLKRFDSLITYIRSLPNCSGYCITQITDVMQEVNGLFTIDRQCKVDKQKLASIIKK